MCTGWHSALGSLSGSYFRDRKFRTSSFFDRNPPSLLPRVFCSVLVGFWRGGEGWWFGGLFCALNHKTRDKHWAYALNYLKDSPPLTEKAQKM